MKKLIGLLIIVVFLSGCIQSKSIAGTYILQNNKSSMNLTIYPDNTFYMVDNGIPYSGAVIVHDSDFIVNGPLGLSNKFTPNGNVLIDQDGDKWVKT